MPDDLFSPRRRYPLHSPAMQVDAVENIPENKDMQRVAVSPAPVRSDVQVYPTAIKEYTISVDQVRNHLRAKGLQKSKDTIQRWCRTGELNCQKRGVLNRFFTTEQSLKLLEQKFLPDMIAEQTGPEQTSMPVHASADAPAHTEAQVHEVTEAPADVSARSSMQPDAADKQPDTSFVAALRAENERLLDEVKFLREEIVAKRGDVKAVTERMLETFNVLAVGRRAQAPRGQDNEPTQTTETVRYQQTEREVNAV